jgi:2-aminoadipate transaminase
VGRLRAEGRRIKFLYVVPNFQNPTGRLMSLARRRWLLEWAARERVLIVEDDPYGALYFEDVASAADTRPLKADDRDGVVIYLSSVSKTLSPGFRTAWIAAPAPIAGKLEIAKQAADLCTSGFDQRMVYEAIASGVLEAQLPRLREFYGRRRRVMEETLRAELGTALDWPEPRGGFFLWARLPQPLDAPVLLERAMAHGVIFVSGHAFFVDGGGHDRIRLAFSLPAPEAIAEGVRRLSSAIREALAEAAAPPAPAAPLQA